MMRHITLFDTVDQEGEGPNLTNLVDIMVILSIASLLLAPSYISLFSHLERADGPAAGSSTAKGVLIEFTIDGEVLWDGTPVPEEEDLEAMIREARSGGVEHFTLAGDRRASYGTSIRLKDILRRSGVTEIRELMRGGQG
ncbi:MAG: hypothetical protein GF355_08550 [Candidatus Eisenbacteria bacterium]|nr:hypothetical protein [Candidatus Eisenbacteria bacterium]